MNSISHRTVAYHEIADDHGEKEERNADRSVAPDAVPHRLDPFSAENAENDHERMKEITEVPTWEIRSEICIVVRSEQLHAHHSKYENNDGQNET